ncbi:MAG: hypothetical protein JWL70_2822 [Acidimicrobiia bacterium]|nr:hypothetical protein [Acidimicrobiia bacterium]
MADVRYVCLSDLHFGASNSLLSHMPDGATMADVSRPSRTLEAFVDCLAAIIDGNEDRSIKPTLVLNGDILELALASDEVALMTFQHFIRLAMAERDLFAHQIVYLPGNHDHHVWETSRERAYADYVARHRDGPLNAPWHATSMFRASDLDVRSRRLATATVQQQILRRFENLRDATVEVRYPAFGLDSPDHQRSVVFHHGHFLASIYLLMSGLKDTTFPASEVAKTLAALEEENFAWIDFFWSTLGRSGQWGSDVGVLYEMLQDREALRAVGANLGRRAAASLPKYVPHRLGRWATTMAMRKAADKINSLERNRPAPPGTVLTATGDASLARFIEGPILSQVAAEGRPRPQQLTFVFGHTHRPLGSLTPFRTLDQPAAVYNTGGWVVDTLDADTLQGASALVLDEHLQAVSVNLYRQVPNGSSPVTATAVDPASQAFLAQVRKLITPGQGVWGRLEQEVASAIPKRYAALQRRIVKGTAEARRRPPVGT